VLFGVKSVVVATATVVQKAHNVELARRLWGVDRDKDTWEYLYFVDEVQRPALPYARLRAAAGYKAGFRMQGFIIATENASSRILDALELRSEVYEEPPTEPEYREAVRKGLLDAEAALETQGRVWLRKEQSLLRKGLLRGRAAAECAICGRSFPHAFLVAAHIKKRAECSREEKLDLEHIAMLACRLGCDIFFERGFVAVRAGMIRVRDTETSAGEVTRALRELRGRVCGAWTTGSAKYFEWHHDHTFRAI
jgi:hypothetical protein